MTIAALKPLHKGLEDLFQKYRSMEFLFGLKLFLAIALGFLVSARTGLAQPQWAAITSATVLNPLSSANASKSFFRLLGTLLAGAITLLIFGACGSSVALILILIGAFIAVSAFWGTLDGTPRGYAFLLAAYTAAIIGMPALNDPSMIFDNAVNRVLEISLGIICAFVVDQILFQKSTVTALHEQISRWIDDVEDWIADVLSGTESDSVLTLRRRKVVYDAASLDQLGVHAQFDPSVPPSFKKLLQRIQNRMLMLIVSIEAVRDRMEILKKQDPGPLTDSCRAAVRDCLLWLEKRRSYQDPKELLDRLSQLELAASSAGETEGPLILSLTDRLREMIAFFTHLRRLAKFVSPRRFKIVSRLPSDETDRSVRHWNPSTAVVTSAVAVLSYAVGCCIWHVTAWPQGSTLTFMAVVAAILFGNSNRPARSIAQAAGMLFYCALLSALYLYGIYPHLHHVESLLASWALLFIPIGVISARNPVG
ncbi:MAG: FUSC family protein, partial [Oligoflexia bacterium]|nr:FUSC family protein [Oligoflexia bacterium]